MTAHLISITCGYSRLLITIFWDFFRGGIVTAASKENTMYDLPRGAKEKRKSGVPTQLFFMRFLGF
jgi:hypothetical protein